MQGVHASAIADLIGRVRARRPRVHCITNTVAQAYTANALLAVGAIPSMTTAADEIESFAAGADALLVNLGTLEADRRQAIAKAIAAARGAGRPWLLDPVFIERSPTRADFVRRLVAESPALVRGNEQEIAVLASGDARAAAGRLGTVVAVTGAVDHISDGRRSASLANGHPWMARVTAMGCAGAAITAAFLAVESDRYLAGVAALAVLGLAGEMAGAEARGPGTFAAAYCDALDRLDAATIASRLTLTETS